MAEKRKIAAFVAVHNAEGAILMGQNVDGQWCAPGGKAEKDESPEEAAARELREEAGIGVETMGYIGSGRGEGTFDVYVFKAVVDNVSPNADGDPDEEFKDFRWVKEDELKELDLKYGDHDVVLGLLGWGPRQPATGEESEEFDPEASYGLAKAVNLRKALADIKPGKVMRSGRIDYSHVLSPQQQQKYKIMVEEKPSTDPSVVDYSANIFDKSNGKSIGAVRGNRRLNEEAGKRYAVLNFSSVDPEHRGKGLGKPAYEAWMAHGRHAGVTHVKGDEHSTNAGKIHSWLSAKHGLDYKAQPNPEYTPAHKELQAGFNAGSPEDNGNWDFKQAPYEYMLKAEPWGHHINRTLTSGAESDIKAQIQNMFQRGGKAEHIDTPVAEAFMARPDISVDTKADFLKLGGGNQRYTKLDPHIVDTMVQKARARNGGKLDGITSDVVERLMVNRGNEDAISPSTVKAFADTNETNGYLVMNTKPMMEKLPPADAGGLVDRYMEKYSGLPTMDAWQAKNLPAETLARIGDRIEPNGLTGQHVKAFLAHPGLGEEAKAKMWNRLKAYHKQGENLDNAGVTKPMVDAWLKENPDFRHDPIRGNKSALASLSKNPNLGDDFWASQFKPGGIVSKHLETGGMVPYDLMGKIKSPEAWRDFAKLPLAAGDEKNHEGNVSLRGLAEHAPDEAIAELHARGIVKASDPHVGDRLYEMGKAKAKLLNVRTGTDKLRTLRDSLQGFPPRHVRELREDGVDVNSLGLNRALDPQGNLTADAVQRVIDAKPARQYGHENGPVWKGAQRHSTASSKVFQLTLPPETLREIRKQGLRPAYDKLLASSAGHPRHGTRGAGWVRYTEAPDGIHIDEIQTDFGHNMGHHLKTLDANAAEGKISAGQRAKLPATDEFARLHQLMWGNEHPSKVLHEAFMEKLRGEKKIGKEVHQWTLHPKMKLAGQDPAKPPPVHMKQTYDEFPQKAGYQASEYGRLSTQSNIGHTTRDGGAPTWASTVKKFELDLDFWMTDNPEMLNKGMKHTLWGLAAATALHAMPQTATAPKPEAPMESVEPANQSVQPPPQASMMPKKEIQPWNPKGLRPEMIPIAHLESSFGKNINHEANSHGDFQTAYGAVGFKPQTAHETYLKSKVLQAAYPGLTDPQRFTEEFKANPEMYNAVASKHFGNLMSAVQTPEKAAFAWRWGIGAAQNASDADVAADPYVVKYKALAAQHAARMKAAIESQFKAPK